MPYKKIILEALSIIKVVYIGDVTLEDRVTLITDLTSEYMTDSRQLKILLDARSLVTSMTKTEQEVWGKFIAANEKLKKAAVAVIYQEEKAINQQAFKNVKLSGHNIQKFHNEELAIKWLSEQ